MYYTLEEISKNNGKDGKKTWIILKNRVYDVTEYIAQNEHPGGVELIEEWAGKDASRAFDDVGHTGDAKDILKKLQIGEVVEDDRNKKRSSNKTVAEKEKDKFSKPTIKLNQHERARKSCMEIITCGLMS